MAPTSNPNAEQMAWLQAVANGIARWHCGEHEVLCDGVWVRVRPRVVVPVVFGGFARYSFTDDPMTARPVLTDDGNRALDASVPAC